MNGGEKPGRASPAPRKAYLGARCAFVAALLAAWASAGTAPLRHAVADVRAPSDFTTDFVPAARLVRALASGTYPAGDTAVDVATGNVEAARLGAPPYAAVGVPYGAHPPPAVLLVAALVPLGFAGAALAWLLLSLAGVAVVAVVAAAAIRPADTGAARGRWRAVGIFVAMTMWPPVLHNIEKGQWSLIIAGLLAGAWWARARGRDATAGALIAVAAAFKIMPLLALFAFMGGATARRRRVLAGAALALAVVVGASLLVLGPHAWSAFVQAAPANTRGWQTGPANTLSLWGALARLLVGGPYAAPLGIARAHPGAALALAWLLWASAALLLLARAGRIVVSSARTHRARPLPVAADSTPDPNEARAYAAWCGLAVVLGPLSWSHTAAFLVVPAALLAGVFRNEAVEDSSDGGQSAPGAAGLTARRRRAALLLLAGGTVMLTLPRLTLFRWAGPFPVSPAGGLLLATHLAGALALICAAVLSARRATTTAPMGQPNGDHPGGVA